MYTKLLWATDGSSDAELALTEALRLLEPGGRLIAFHCDQRFVGGRVGGEPVVADETDRRSKIRDRVAELAASGIDAELIVETTHHSAAHEIAKAADELAVELIVCGTRGLGGLQGALLGSVARELLHHAHVPVLVVPPKIAVAAG
ncbi:MAG TPA: universal stress protein [Gaiellaceae bacterium]